ncbi:MAG: hypothetical protein JRC77_09410, partial [Deltaproteobacteria bacterium]|nr:hypothetical protein [Deltaproteobacteria bacterium]
MSISGSFKVARRTLESLGGLLLDAVADPFGGAIPLSPERVATPEFLSALLRDHAVDATLGNVQIESAALLDIKSVSSNCNNSVLSIEGHGAASLPTSLFMKQPAPEFLTRAFCHMIRIWELECRFYREVAPQLPIRTPKAWAVAHQGTRFVMLLENLHADTQVELFTNP